MNNASLVRLLKDARSGKVRRLDQETLGLYGLTDSVLRISNDELCERLITEHDRYQQTRIHAIQHREQVRATMVHRQTHYYTELARLENDNRTLRRNNIRWHHFLLGWSAVTAVLLLLSLLGPDLNGFAAGWALSLGSLLIAPKLKTAYRILTHVTRVLCKVLTASQTPRKTA